MWVDRIEAVPGELVTFRRETFDIEVTATNENGQAVTYTSFIITPIPED